MQYVAQRTDERGQRQKHILGYRRHDQQRSQRCRPIDRSSDSQWAHYHGDAVPETPVCNASMPVITVGCADLARRRRKANHRSAVVKYLAKYCLLVTFFAHKDNFGTRAAPSYLAAHAVPHHPDELGVHRCINHFSPRTGKIFDWAFAKNGVRIQNSLRGYIALDDENSYLAAVEAGLGIAQIPAFALKEAMERGSLELLLGDWFPEPAPLNVVYTQNRHLSSKIRVFVDWVAELFSEHDGIQLRSTLHKHVST